MITTTANITLRVYAYAYVCWRRGGAVNCRTNDVSEREKFRIKQLMCSFYWQMARWWGGGVSRNNANIDRLRTRERERIHSSHGEDYINTFSNTTANENERIMRAHTENLIIMCERDILRASMNRINHTYISVCIYIHTHKRDGRDVEYKQCRRRRRRRMLCKRGKLEKENELVYVCMLTAWRSPKFHQCAPNPLYFLSHTNHPCGRQDTRTHTLLSLVETPVRWLPVSFWVNLNKVVDRLHSLSVFELHWTLLTCLLASDCFCSRHPRRPNRFSLQPPDASLVAPVCLALMEFPAKVSPWTMGSLPYCGCANSSTSFSIGDCTAFGSNLRKADVQQPV